MSTPSRRIPSFPRTCWALVLPLSSWLALSPTVKAEWTASGAGPFLYDSPSNWHDGTIDNIFTNDPGAAQQTVDFTTNRTLVDGFLIQVPLSSDTAGTPFLFRARNADNTGAENRTLTLQGAMSIALGTGSTAKQTVQMGENGGGQVNFDFDGGARTITVNPGETGGSSRWDQLTIFGNLTNGTGLTKSGAGILSLQADGAASSPLTGVLEITGGKLQLGGQSAFSAISEVRLSNSFTRLEFNNNLSGNATDRLGDAIPLSASGAYTAIALIGSSVAASSETIGQVTMNGGGLLLGAHRSGGQTATLTVAEIVRANTNNMLLIGTNSEALSGVESRVLVNSDANLLADLVGGGGAAGSTNISILPWARGTLANDNTGNPQIAGFVTYTSDGGFRLLKEAEYVSTLAAAAVTDNVRLTAGETLAASRTVNSIFVAGGNPTINTGGYTLTVTSGAIAAGGSGFSMQFSNASGTLTTGNSRSLSFTGPGNITVSARITGEGGVTVGSVATSLILNNSNNTYTGDTVVIGTLIVSGNNVIPDASDVVLAGGTFQLGLDASARTETIGNLSGFGTVTFSNGSNKLNIGSSTVADPGQVKIAGTTEVTPGDSTGFAQIGTIAFGNNISSLLIDENVTLNFQLGGLNDYDRITLSSGAVTIDGGTLTLSLLDGYAPNVGDVFHLFAGSSAAAGTGFDQINGPAGYTFSGYAQGNDWVIEVTAVPEPTTGVLALAGLLAFASRRKKRLS
jgi:hypothetical protein